MTEWEPATEAEAAMRDALRAGDQELYFRILARTDLLLPVAAEALVGQAPMGWGTWTTGGRTHVLAFTSPGALQACLADNASSARRVSYQDLAASWPNIEWWLAVNPGLPIEGYLPAWFVSQLARGDVRLPGRTMGAHARLERIEAVGRARATATVPGRVVPPDTANGPTQAAPEPSALRGPAAPSAAAAGVAAAAAPAPAAPAVPRWDALGSAAPASVPTVNPGQTQQVGANGDAFTGEPPGAPGAGWYAATAASSVETRPPGAASEQPRPNDAGRSPSGLPRRPVGVTSPQPDRSPIPAQPGVVAPPAPPGRPELAAPPAPAAQAAPLAPDVPGFTPANEVEENLLAAAGGGSTNSFLSTLLLAKVLLPVSPESASGARPGDHGFVWRTETLDAETYVVVFTSRERLDDHLTEPVETVDVKFVQMIRKWPDRDWSFAINPSTPVSAKLPGAQIVALASWAAEVGLGDEAEGEPAEPAPVEEPTPRSTYAPAREDAGRPTIMQKTIAPSQVDYYLNRGYDRVSGFVHRTNEVAHLTTPAKLRLALGLDHPGSPFGPNADEIYVLRWPAYRPSLYRIPYGGQSEAAMRAMEGWVIERAPFRGNGFAPGNSSDVIAEFKVDSARLPHGSQLWRIASDGSEKLVATLDCDVFTWRRAGETDA